MDREGIKELLRELAGPNVELIDHSKWVSFHCLFAPWTHSKGTDKTPSAGISVNESGDSIFHCYACIGRKKGPLTWFLKEYEKYTGENLSAAIREIENNEFLGGSLPEWGQKPNAKAKLEPLDPVIYEDLYDPAEGHWYLKSRGITSKRAIRAMGLCIDPSDSQGYERILFPVYTPDNQLVGFTGRAVEKPGEQLPENFLKVRDYFGLRKELVLLGSHLIHPEDEFVAVVEGLFDYAKLVQIDAPVVASLHAGMTDAQAKILRGLGKPVVLFYDDDPAGREAIETAHQKLVKYLPVSKARYPKVKGRTPCRKRKTDPGGMQEEDLLNAIQKATLL